MSPGCLDFSYEGSGLPVFRRLKHRLGNLEPATIREIIAVVVILILAIALSIPQFRDDMEALRKWEQVHKHDANMNRSGESGTGEVSVNVP